MHPRLTLAVLAKPVSEKVLKAIGLAERKPFYTVDFPYLWGRVRQDRSIVWGAGLVQSPDEDDLDRVDIAAPEPAQIFTRLEERVTASASRARKNKIHAPLGRPHTFPRQLEASLRLASAKPRTWQECDRHRRIRRPRRRAFVLPRQLGRRDIFTSTHASQLGRHQDLIAFGTNRRAGRIIRVATLESLWVVALATTLRPQIQNGFSR